MIGLNLTPVEVAVFGSNPAPDTIEASRYRCERVQRLILAQWPQPKRRRRQRKPSLARLVAKAKQLGVDVTIEPNGTVTFHTGSSPSATVDGPEAELEKWIAKQHAH